MGMRVGELARRTGVGASTLRAWEARFHFLEPARSSSGHRLYDEADVGRVAAVVRLVAEGLTLAAAIARVSGMGTGALPAGEGEALLYGQILHVAGQGVWVAKDGRTRYANRRMAEIMRCSVDELLATPVLDFHDPDLLPATKQRSSMLRAGNTLHFTQQLRRPDGSTFVAEIDCAPLINQAGRFEGSVALVSDISARTEAETQARFRIALLDSIGEAVAAANPDGKIVYINAAAERLLGWRAADVIGKDGRALMPARDATCEADEIHARLVAGERHVGKLKLTRRDGTDFIGHLTASPAFDELGAVIGLIAVITDQSERVQIDRERRDLELQTETLALLGAQALRQRAGDGRATTLVLTEAVEATRRLLGSDHVAVLDVIGGADELRIRISSPPIQEPTAVLSGSRSFAGYVALARKVVVVNDTRHEWRFEPCQTWPGFRPASAIGAPIFGPDGLRGVIAAELSAPRRFDQASSHFLQGIANIIGTALLDEGPPTLRGRSRTS